MGMVQALPTGQLSETALLPKGTRFLLAGAAGGGSVCRTLKDLRILPIVLKDTRLLMRPGSGYRLVISLESMYERVEPIGQMRICIDHLNNYQTSLMIFDALKSNLSGDVCGI